MDTEQKRTYDKKAKKNILTNVSWHTFCKRVVDE